MPISHELLIIAGLILAVQIASTVVLWLLGRRKAREKPVSIEDIEHLIRTGTHQGLLDPAEQLLARRALRLGDRTVRERHAAAD